MRVTSCRASIWGGAPPKPIVQPDLGGMDAGKFVVKAELPTPYSRPGMLFANPHVVLT